MDKVDQYLKEAIGKTQFETTYDAIKTVGAGNGAGLIGSAAAFASAVDKQWSNAIWLKCAAICFTLGVFCFAYAYHSFYRAMYSVGDEARERVESERTGQPITPPVNRNTAKEFSYKASSSTLISLGFFYLGTFIVLVILVLAPTSR